MRGIHKSVSEAAVNAALICFVGFLLLVLAVAFRAAWRAV